MRVEAIYEGGVLKLGAPLPLPEHTRLYVEVVTASDAPRLSTLPREAWDRVFGSVSLGGNALADSEAYYDATSGSPLVLPAGGAKIRSREHHEGTDPSS